MAHNLVGKVVMVVPKRAGFAISSASWAELPSDKYRPCLITSVTADGGVLFSPLCGGYYEKKNGIYTPRPNMIQEHWLPIDWQLQGVGALGAPQSKSDTVLKLSADPAKLKKGLPPFKPCFLWIGDVGEKMLKEEFEKLQEHVAINPVGDKVLQFIKDRQAKVSAEDSKVLSQFNAVQGVLGEKVEKK